MSSGDVMSVSPVDKMHPVVAIGNFDGAHLGHARVAAVARALATRIHAKGGTLALTFEPHPRRFFQPDAPFFRLTMPDQRAIRLAAIGFDRHAVLSFDAALAGMSAEDFVRTILVEKVRAAGVVVGADFHFGKGRAGTPDFLADAGLRHGFAVEFVPPHRDDDGTVMSSSAIRAALEAGEIARANRLLGYDWAVTGTVIHGEKRGRDLGYPTANMRLAPDCRLAHGIYAVWAMIDGVAHPAVASFGRRPTFDNGAPLLETHVFDFSGDLYGKTIEVHFVGWLRAEAKFDSLDALIAQMNDDSAQARAVLGASRTG